MKKKFVIFLIVLLIINIFAGCSKEDEKLNVKTVFEDNISFNEQIKTYKAQVFVDISQNITLKNGFATNIPIKYQAVTSNSLDAFSIIDKKTIDNSPMFGDHSKDVADAGYYYGECTDGNWSIETSINNKNESISTKEQNIDILSFVNTLLSEAENCVLTENEDKSFTVAIPPEKSYEALHTNTCFVLNNVKSMFGEIRSNNIATTLYYNQDHELYEIKMDSIIADTDYDGEDAVNNGTITIKLEQYNNNFTILNPIPEDTNKKITLQSESDIWNTEYYSFYALVRDYISSDKDYLAIPQIKIGDYDFNMATDSLNTLLDSAELIYQNDYTFNYNYHNIPITILMKASHVKIMIGPIDDFNGIESIKFGKFEFNKTNISEIKNSNFSKINFGKYTVCETKVTPIDFFDTKYAMYFNNDILCGAMIDMEICPRD